jgi:hypothetical protein
VELEDFSRIKNARIEMSRSRPYWATLICNLFQRELWMLSQAMSMVSTLSKVRHFIIANVVKKLLKDRAETLTLLGNYAQYSK